MANLKFALRTLFKTPFVTVVAIASLALGIGATAAIFSVFNEVLLRPLPVPEPERLVNLAAPGPSPGNHSCNQTGDCEEIFSYPMFRDLEKVQQVFTTIAAHVFFGANLAFSGQTMNGEGVLVSGSYFPVLGLTPAFGRLLTPEDDRAVGESHVVVLSYGWWQTRFGANPGVVGQSMIVNGQPMTIVGVAPRGFKGTTIGYEPQVFVPITMRGLMSPGSGGGFQGISPWANRRNYWAYLFARLRPGVSIEQARASLNAQYHGIINDVEAPLQRGMSEQTMARFKAKDLIVKPGAQGQSNAPRIARQPLAILLGVTILVLIIACANIANLLLARATARAGEMGIRLSLGAGRRHLVAQLLTESLLLAVFGGGASIFVARWTLDAIASFVPAEVAGALTFSIDRPTILFASVVTLGTGLLFGLFPALHSTRPDLLSALKSQSGQPSGGRKAARFRTSLATAQIALSMALLVGAGLFAKSLAKVSRVDLGLKPDNVVTFRLSPNLNGYTRARTQALYERLEGDLAALPGVTGVTESAVGILAGNNWGRSLIVEGFNAGPDTDTDASTSDIGIGYYRTLGIPLLAGREFTESDGLGAPKVAIVNEAFVKKFNLGRDVVGKRIGNREPNGGGSPDIEIVGLVQNSKYSDVKKPVPAVFVRPYRQEEQLGGMAFYVRTSLSPEQSFVGIRSVIAKADPELPIERLQTLPQQIEENVFLDRMITTLSASFAVLATLLAAIGLYGVLAYTVAQRTREIGLRMALGAAPARVRAMVLGQVGRMTLVGGTIGLLAAVWLGRTAEALLYQLKGWDPVVLVGSAVLLAAVAAGAGFIPAHRASKVDPMQALRYE